MSHNHSSSTDTQFIQQSKNMNINQVQIDFIDSLVQQFQLRGYIPFHIHYALINKMICWKTRPIATFCWHGQLVGYGLQFHNH